MSGTPGQDIFTSTNTYVRKNVFTRKKHPSFNSSLAELANYLYCLNPDYKIETTKQTIDAEFIQSVFERTLLLEELGILTADNVKKIKTLLNHIAREEQERLSKSTDADSVRMQKELNARIIRNKKVKEQYDQKNDPKYSFLPAFTPSETPPSAQELASQRLADKVKELESDKAANLTTKKKLKRKAIFISMVVGINSGLVSAVFAAGKVLFGFGMTLSKAIPIIAIPGALINFALFYGASYRTEKKNALNQVFRDENGNELTGKAKQATKLANVLSYASATCSGILYFSSALTAIGSLGFGTSTAILPFAALIAAGPLGWLALAGAIFLGALTAYALKNVYFDTSVSLIAKLANNKAFNDNYDHTKLGANWKYLYNNKRSLFYIGRTIAGALNLIKATPKYTWHKLKNFFQYDPVKDGGTTWKLKEDLTVSEKAGFYTKKCLTLLFGIVGGAAATVLSGLFYVFSPKVFRGDAFSLFHGAFHLSAKLANAFSWSITGVGSILNFVFKSRGMRAITPILQATVKPLVSFALKAPFKIIKGLATGFVKLVTNPVAAVVNAGSALSRGWERFTKNITTRPFSRLFRFSSRVVLGASAVANGAAQSLALGEHIAPMAALGGGSALPNTRAAMELTAATTTGHQPQEQSAPIRQGDYVSLDDHISPREKNIKEMEEIYRNDVLTADEKKKSIGSTFYQQLEKNDGHLSDTKKRLYTTANVFANFDGESQRPESNISSVAARSDSPVSVGSQG